MMSLSDFREKQLLIIASKDATENKLQFKNENICLLQDDKIINQLSCHKVLAVFIIGDFSITTVLIKNCQQYGVSLFLLKDNFFPYASIISLGAGNYVLRSKQYNCDKELEIAKHLVFNKVLSQQLLLKPTRSEKTKKDLSDKIKLSLEKINNSKELLGFEGSKTKQYFSAYFADIGWYRRMPRTKIDITNLLMDMGYTMLFNYVDSISGLFGFDSYKGVYHTLYFQRKSLICDLVEPFRCIIDRQIIKSYNLNQIQDKDFKKIKGTCTISYELQKKYVKIFAEAIMEQKEDIFCYIRDYYYCIMNDNNNYPIFYID